MDKNEVALLETVIREQSTLSPKICQIGNGEWIVALKLSIYDFHLWSIEDWNANKQYWRKLCYKL